MTPDRISSLLRRLSGLVLALAAAGAYAQQTAAPPPAVSQEPAERPAAPRPAPSSGQEDPATLILSDSLHYDDVKKLSTFTGNVVMTRGAMTLNADKLEMREDAQGFQFGTATAHTGKMVYIRQERPERFEVIEARGLRAEYDGKSEQMDIIGQAIVTRQVCGKALDSISGQRVRYNQKNDTYAAEGGPESAAAGGRVRSVAQPRNRTDAAIAECRQAKQP